MIFTHGRWIRCREEVTINFHHSVGSTDALKGLRAHQADQRPTADGDPQCGQADSIRHADDGPAGVASARHGIGRQCSEVLRRFRASPIATLGRRPVIPLVHQVVAILADLGDIVPDVRRDRPPLLDAGRPIDQVPRPDLVIGISP